MSVLLEGTYPGSDIVEETFNDETCALIIEGAIADTCTNGEIEAFLESNNEIQSAINDNILEERTIVRLDKKAKLSQARMIAIFSLAKQKGDPKYKKLEKLWMMEREIEKYLINKYGNEGTRVAKKSLQAKKNGSSKVVNKALAGAKADFNKPVTVTGKDITKGKRS